MDLRDADMLPYCIVQGGAFEHLNSPDPPVCVAIKQSKKNFRTTLTPTPCMTKLHFMFTLHQHTHFAHCWVSSNYHIHSRHYLHKTTTYCHTYKFCLNILHFYPTSTISMPACSRCMNIVARDGKYHDIVENIKNMGYFWYFDIHCEAEKRNKFPFVCIFFNTWQILVKIFFYVY